MDRRLVSGGDAARLDGKRSGKETSLQRKESLRQDGCLAGFARTASALLA